MLLNLTFLDKLFLDTEDFNVGDIKQKTFFTFLPICLDGKVKFLQYVTIEYEYVEKPTIMSSGYIDDCNDYQNTSKYCWKKKKFI